ncbi:MAG: hypothetical protein AB7O26_02755 [Planctomycetaceae bacterium]
MSFEIAFARNRTVDKIVRIFEPDGITPVVLAAADAVRFKLYRRNGAAPLADITSSAPTENGSRIIIDDLDPATVTLRLAQGDTEPIEPGIYDAEICVVDDSETAPADAIKQAEHGVVHILGTAGGDLGLS